MLKFPSLDLFKAYPQTTEIDPRVVKMAFPVGADLKQAQLAPEGARTAYITENAYGRRIIYTGNALGEAAPEGEIALRLDMARKGGLHSEELTAAKLTELGLKLTRNMGMLVLSQIPRQTAEFV